MSFFTHLRGRPAPAGAAGPGHPTVDGDRAPGDEPAGDGATEDSAAGDGATEDSAAGTGADGRTGARRVVARVTTVLAGLFVFVALVLPDQLVRLRPGALVQIPLEGVLGVALLLVLPATARRVGAAVAGVVLGLLTILKLTDLGFYATLGRPFDLVLDWGLLGDAVGTLGRSTGRVGAAAAAVAVGALAVAVLVLMARSVQRLSRLAARHRTVAARAVAVSGVAWIACALLGAQLVPGVPVASRSTVALAYGSARQAHTSLTDPRVFAAQRAVDAFRDTPGDQMLTALRGKDVIFSFIESYGRNAVEDPALASIVGPVLDDGARELAAAGFASRSAFLTSSTYGGASWTAHATLQSGLWINSQQRYRALTASDRLTLASAFRRADWRTVAVMPGTAGAWPEGAFYRFDQIYAAQNLGYRGPAFTLGTMPDQYTLSAFQRLEYGRPDRGPMMAEIELTSSHAPWAPVPRAIDWNDVGDGSVFTPMVKEGDQPDYVWRDQSRIRTAYARSIAYSVGTLIDWVKNYGNDNLVLVFLGDHQPAVVTDIGASRDVPVTIVAKDPAVLDRISGWGWQDGLKPGPGAPVWRMDSFRDRFLTAFGSQGGPVRSPAGSVRSATPPVR
ncbi:sulfatase-like hydrolase/transferase [Planosporangium sp. 12N6]|uniref:sulfatase-like hydrolase/transferase n=1 Tax=Planosporangium spinosum TaxID=3402278 RepID=UPI003CE7956C